MKTLSQKPETRSQNPALYRASVARQAELPNAADATDTWCGDSDPAEVTAFANCILKIAIICAGSAILLIGVLLGHVLHS
jgi:hypothetical protein